MSVERHERLKTGEQFELATVMLRMMALWSDVVGFLADEVTTLENRHRRHQYERTLCDTDTLQLALFLIRRHCQGGEPYTLNELAGVLEIDEGLRKSAKQRIRDTVLPRVADHYGLFAYSRPDNPNAGNGSYRIWATERLVDFFATTLGPQLQALLGR
mgnify:CR=1 FL=1